MAIVIGQKVPEEGVAVFTASFTDEDGTACIPTTVTWTLTDSAGTVINSRSAVSVTPAASVKIVLQGDDLALQGASDDYQRILYVKAVYTSTTVTAGTNHKEVWFEIEPMVNAT
jgi:hypothetical protein